MTALILGGSAFYVLLCAVVSAAHGAADDRRLGINFNDDCEARCGKIERESWCHIGILHPASKQCGCEWIAAENKCTSCKRVCNDFGGGHATLAGCDRETDEEVRSNPVPTTGVCSCQSQSAGPFSHLSTCEPCDPTVNASETDCRRRVACNALNQTACGTEGKGLCEWCANAGHGAPGQYALCQPKGRKCMMPCSAASSEEYCVYSRDGTTGGCTWCPSQNTCVDFAGVNVANGSTPLADHQCAVAGDCDQYCARVTQTDCFIRAPGSPYGWEPHPRTTICGCELNGTDTPRESMSTCRSCNATCRALGMGCAKGYPRNGTSPKSADGCYCFAYDAEMYCFPCAPGWEPKVCRRYL